MDYETGAPDLAVNVGPLYLFTPQGLSIYSCESDVINLACPCDFSSLRIWVSGPGGLRVYAGGSVVNGVAPLPGEVRIDVVSAAALPSGSGVLEITLPRADYPDYGVYQVSVDAQGGWIRGGETLDAVKAESYNASINGVMASGVRAIF